MILLIAARDSTRTTLVSFLEHEELSVKICDAFTEGMRQLVEFPEFQIVIADYRVEDGDVRFFMADLVRKRHPAPLIVVGAPLKAEADLFRNGAFAVLGPGYSPRSVALQCANLNRFLGRRAPQRRRGPAKAIPDFRFGTAIVSPEKRLLLPKRRGRGKEASVRLSRLQLGLLHIFWSHPRRILKYEFLYHSVWRRAYQGDNAAIREAVSSLRERFQAIGLDLDNWLVTIYGDGFRYNPRQASRG